MYYYSMEDYAVCLEMVWNKDTGVCEIDIQVSSNDLNRVVQLHDGRLVYSSYSSGIFRRCCCTS
jgi:hypothetical protein